MVYLAVGVIVGSRFGRSVKSPQFCSAPTKSKKFLELQWKVFERCPTIVTDHSVLDMPWRAFEKYLSAF